MDTIVAIIGLLGCVVLILHAAMLRRPAERGVSVEWRLVLLAVMEYLALWLWLAILLPLLAWMFLFGDNDLWFYHSASVFASAIAALTTAISIRHIAKGNATLSYWRVHFWGPLLLLAFFGAVRIHGFVERIEGWSADQAAQRHLARCIQHEVFDEPIHLVERRDLPNNHDPARCKSYWIMGVKEPRGYVTFCRYGWFWWQYAGSARFPPSQSELNRAKERLRNSSDDDGAVLTLKSIVENYPGTEAQAEAQRLLRSLEEE